MVPTADVMTKNTNGQFKPNYLQSWMLETTWMRLTTTMYGANLDTTQSRWSIKVGHKDQTNEKIRWRKRRTARFVDPNYVHLIFHRFWPCTSHYPAFWDVLQWFGSPHFKFKFFIFSVINIEQLFPLFVLLCPYPLYYCFCYCLHPWIFVSQFTNTRHLLSLF